MKAFIGRLLRQQSVARGFYYFGRRQIIGLALAPYFPTRYNASKMEGW